jgi:predicted PhzF superfamily epimerase YddE/YHI9
VPVLHLLRVFCSDEGGGGNPLAVFLDGSEVAEDRRQQVAADLGLPETVFVDDRTRGEIRILTPEAELDFAGHPSVGTAWLLAKEGTAVEALDPPAGKVAVRYAAGLAFCTARPEWGPQIEWVEFGSPEEIEALTRAPEGHDLTGCWAWADEDAGIVRARVFLVPIGIAEDEATGSAATKLAAQLDRAIDIRQGRASRIQARPLDAGWVEIGGRTELDEVREYEVPATR